MSDKTLNQIIADAGIKTIRNPKDAKDVKLEYNGISIFRGFCTNVYHRVKQNFSIDLKEFE